MLKVKRENCVKSDKYEVKEHKKEGTYKAKEKSKPFSCHRCEKSYGSQIALNAHLKTKHMTELILQKSVEMISSKKNDNVVNPQTRNYYEVSNFSCDQEVKNFDMPLNFLGLKKYEDYLKDIKSRNRSKQGTYRKTADVFDYMIKLVIDNVFSELYLQSNLYGKEKDDKIDISRSEMDWISMIAIRFHLLEFKVQNPQNLTIIKFIQILYKECTSLEKIPFLELLSKKFDKSQENLKVNTSYSIDEVFITFIYANKSQLCAEAMFFLIKLLSFLREFINLKYYLIYNKVGYTESFSPDILPSICYEFFIHLFTHEELKKFGLEVTEETDLYIPFEDNYLLFAILESEMNVEETLNIAKSMQSEEKTSLIFNFDKFMQAVKPMHLKIKAHNSSNMIRSMGSDYNVSQNSLESNSRHSLLFLDDITSTSEKADVVDEVFFYLDYFCMWLIKHNLSSKAFSKAGTVSSSRSIN